MTARPVPDRGVSVSKEFDLGTKGNPVEGRLRLPGSATDALAALDDLIATSIIGRQEFARNLGLSVTDLVCFA